VVAAVASTLVAVAVAVELSLELASLRPEYIRSLLEPEVLETVPTLEATQMLIRTPTQAQTAEIQPSPDPEVSPRGAPRAVVRVGHRTSITRLLVMEAPEVQVVVPPVTQMAQLGRAVLQPS
jgi:hypothetical protein